MGSASEELNPAHSFFRHASSDETRTALVIDGRAHSYGELARAALAIAGWVRATCGEAPRRVGVLAGRSFDAFAGILGAACAGHTYVPLAANLPPQRLALLLRRASLSALILDDAGARTLTPEAASVAPAARWLGAAAPEVEPLAGPVAVEPTRAAYVIFTSGTTGVPKGVVVSTGSLASFVASVSGMYDLGPRDRMSQCPDLTWDLSVFDLYVAWHAGASLHVVPELQRMAPARFIAKERLTVWCSAPAVATMMGELKQLKPNAFPSLRVTMFCGEPLTRKAAEAWRLAAPASVIDNHFGPTEATCSCLFHRFDDDARITPARDIVAIGRPFPGMHAALVDEAERIIAGTEPGELILSGPQLATGYLDEPALTAESFRPFDAADPDVWYFTGDRAYRDAHGVFHHLGRVDHQVKILGKRIELEEIEAHLRTASGRDSVAAVAWPRKDGLPVGLVAFVAAPVNAAALRATLLRLVPPYMVPRRIIAIERLPTTANGKVDRRSLLEILEREG
jgi:amino acid adenylation domain-containing protein